MPDELSRVFEVVCKGCSRSLMTVERLRDPEIDSSWIIRAARGHADVGRGDGPRSEPLGDTPMLGEVMARVRVAAVERA